MVGHSDPIASLAKAFTVAAITAGALCSVRGPLLQFFYGGTCARGRTSTRRGESYDLPEEHVAFVSEVVGQPPASPASVPDQGAAPSGKSKHDAAPSGKSKSNTSGNALTMKPMEWLSSTALFRACLHGHMGVVRCVHSALLFVAMTFWGGMVGV